ncbi:MAG: metal ion ABC transporter substrate-binding protein, partial [Alistipes sp.]|nr:metal ion ABC transporter substrate-binding protein [Alistipes sp.]
MLLTACITNNRQNNRILYVSIQPLQSLVDSIVGGDFEVEVLVPAGASPET